jgi:hypothetical protein
MRVYIREAITGIPTVAALKKARANSSGTRTIRFLVGQIDLDAALSEARHHRSEKDLGESQYLLHPFAGRNDGLVQHKTHWKSKRSIR